MGVPKPSYPLNDVKKLIRDNNVFINDNAQEDAWNDFNWRLSEIKKCLLKLNDKYHKLDREKNHFVKTEPHKKKPTLMVDAYRAKNIMKNVNIYVHFYIHPGGNLIINSFKEL